MKPGKVLILSFHFPPVNGPAVQHALWFHRFLPHSGMETTTISSSAYAGENIGSDTPVQNRIRVPESAFGQKVSQKLHLAEMLVQNQMSLWEHGFIWAEFAIRRAIPLLQSGEYSHIVSVSPFITSHWAAYRLKRKFPHIRWVADFQDPFIGNPFRTPKPSIRRMEERFEKQVFEHADLLSANTDTVREMWAQRYPQHANKMIVTWGGYDPDEQIAALPIPPRNKRLLSHNGSVYSSRLPHSLLSTIADLARNNRLAPDVQLEFFGPMETHRLRNPHEFQQLQSDGWVTLTNSYVSRKSAIHSMCEADYLLLLDITYPHHTILQVPSKLFDYVRVGRPILAFTPKNSPTARILGGSGIPHTIVEPEASQSVIADSLLEFLRFPAHPTPASQWFIDTFDARNIVQRFGAAIASGTYMPVKWPTSEATEPTVVDLPRGASRQ